MAAATDRRSGEQDHVHAQDRHGLSRQRCDHDDAQRHGRDEDAGKRGADPFLAERDQEVDDEIAFGEIDRALDEIARANAAVSGPLVLATGATATTHLLPPVMADLRLRHPGIDLSVMTGNTVDMIPGLLDGSIDLGLLTAPVRDKHLRSRFFFRDRLVCITPPGQAPSAKAIRPRDLEGRQLFLYDRGGSIRRAADGMRNPETGELMNQLRWQPWTPPKPWQPYPTVFQQADKGRPNAESSLHMREAPACHIHRTSPFGPQQQRFDFQREASPGYCQFGCSLDQGEGSARKRNPNRPHVFGGVV